MKINPKVCLTKQQNVISLCCAKTGIVSALVVPKIPAINGKEQVFEYVHPLSYWSNAAGMVKAGRDYLEKLEAPLLAGLVITAYEHYGLLDRYELSAQEANAVLCTASDNTLIELVQLASYFTAKNTAGVPSLVLEWKDVRYMVTIDRMLAAYEKDLRGEFINPTKDVEGRNKRDITVLHSSVADKGKVFKNGVIMLSKKQSMMDFEKDFDVVFKAAKKECTELLEACKDRLEDKMKNFLSTILKGRSLVAMSEDVRGRLCTKLEGLGIVEAGRMAELIRQCNNPYDIFAKADDLLERASDSFVRADKPKSLAEILAAKRAASVAKPNVTNAGNEQNTSAHSNETSMPGNEPSNEGNDDKVISKELGKLAALEAVEELNQELEEAEEIAELEELADLEEEAVEDLASFLDRKAHGSARTDY